MHVHESKFYWGFSIEGLHNGGMQLYENDFAWFLLGMSLNV